MNKNISRGVLLSLGIVSASVAFADSPQRVANDERIQRLTYCPNHIYDIVGKPGYTTAIKFAKGEQVLSVNVGDATAWTVSVSNAVINLKPITLDGQTNMNVVTSRGTYGFDLQTSSVQAQDKHNRAPSSSAVYQVVFQYPQHTSVKTAHRLLRTAKHHLAYSIYGNRHAAPVSVWDDRHFTHVKFATNQPLPAVFAVDEQGNKSLVNYHFDNGWLVVEQMAKQFAFLRGSQRADVFREEVAQDD